MPRITIRDTELYYIDTGTNDDLTPPKETLVFAHGLLWDHTMFLPQIEALRGEYRCIAFDFRGQGKSPSTQGGYDMDNLTQDILELINKLVDEPVHFVGLSMGGFIGMRLAIHYPEQLKSLMLLETTADPEPQENKPKYLMLCFVAKWLSTLLIVDKVMAIMFGQSFLNDPNKTALKTEWENKLKKLQRWTFGRAVKGVIHREGIYDLLNKIQTPTLIIVGDEDVATVPAQAQRIHKAIKNAQLKTVKQAGHTVSIEQPELVNGYLKAFLKDR